MNQIHSTAVIEPGVALGDNNYIGAYAVIKGNTIIGSGNRIEGSCSIGAPAEHREYFFNDGGSTVIGDNNVIREYVTINAGTKEKTKIGNKCVLQRGCYIGHDCVLENGVTLSSNVLVGGHCYIMIGANFGLGSMCHQFSVIGGYSMIGMGTTILKRTMVRPGFVYVGSPAKVLKKNEIGLERSGLTSDDLETINSRYLTLVSENVV